MLRLPYLLVSIALLLGAVAAPTATATPATDAVDALNELRLWAGVGAVTHDPVLTAGCASHASWMSTNRTFAHAQTPGTPGYSKAGSDTGISSVLASTRPFRPMATIDSVPWLRGAPIHLFQMLHPALARSGYAYLGNYSCLVVKDVASYPAIDVFDPTRGRDTIKLWPPDGAGNLPPSEDASHETPNPYELVGLPSTQRSGPFVLVFASGFGATPACAGVRFASASITAADGTPVPTRYWDDAKERARLGVSATQCTVPSGGGWILAEQPLDPSVKYTVSVTVAGVGSTGPAVTSTRAWDVTTGTEESAASGLPNSAGDTAKPVVKLVRGTATRRGGVTRWNVRLSVRDASVTKCSARVAGRVRRCVVRRGVIVLAGAQRGTIKRVAWRVVVRDTAGYVTAKAGVLR